MQIGRLFRSAFLILPKINTIITIVVGTNRADSRSEQIAQYYQKQLQTNGTESQILNLKDLPHDFAFTALYEKSGKNDLFNVFRQQIENSEKYVFIVPEYNGSFPGILKTFIDGLQFPDSFKHKKCALVGLSNGMQGSGIAVSHLTDIFNYLGMHVLALKVKLAFVGQHFDGKELTHAVYDQLLKDQAKQLIAF
jgi:chromate reductase, NAD(P)H dehydrogenase (quinone)